MRMETREREGKVLVEKVGVAAVACDSVPKLGESTFGRILCH